MLWRTLGALLLGAAVAVGVANLVVAVGSDGARRPPPAVELVPVDRDLSTSSVPDTTAPPVTDGSPGPAPSVVVPPPVHVDPAPSPRSPPPPPPSDDDIDDIDEADEVDEVDEPDEPDEDDEADLGED